MDFRRAAVYMNWRQADRVQHAGRFWSVAFDSVTVAQPPVRGDRVADECWRERGFNGRNNASQTRTLAR